MLLIGIPVALGLAIQGVIAVAFGDQYEREALRVVKGTPAAAQPLQDNVAAQQAMGKFMGPAATLAFASGLLVAFAVAARMYALA
jgi:hypothetical protein